MSMAQDKKKLLYERMNKIAGMPLKKDMLSEHKVSPEQMQDAAEKYEEYDESNSYQVKLDNITKCASELHDKIRNFDNLPTWVQDKITIAEHNMMAIHGWIKTLAHQEDEMDNEKIEINYMDEGIIDESKNKPNDPALWSRAKSAAKKKFDVYPCVPEENSKALTKKGWKFVDELNIGDEILSFDPLSNSLKYTEILNLHRYKNADVIKFQSNNLNYGYEATPTHKAIVGNHYDWIDSINEVICKYKKLELVTENGDIELHNEDIYEYIYNNNKLVKPKEIFDLSKSDGFVVVSANIDKSYNLNTCVNYENNPIDMILNMSYDQLKSFLYGSIICDGWENSNTETCVSYEFRQKNKDSYDAIALAGFLTGHLVSVGKESDNKNYRNVKIETKSYIELDKMEIIDLNSQKNVWCPETRFGTWVMKQNDTITITGNSAYANAWASKWYKEKGGTWSKKKK